MTIAVFCAVLGAALLHAAWNALIKTGANKQTAMMVLNLGNAAVGLVVAASRPWPTAEVWIWIIASGVIHAAYQLFLAYAYDQGDLSRVYPLARGTAPMIVLLATLVFAFDTITGTEVAGVALLGAGLAVMTRGIFVDRESARMIPFALGSACATAGYTLIDGLGVRIGGDAFAYVGWMSLVTSMAYVPVVLALRGRTVIPRGRAVWGRGMLAGTMSYTAYTIVVWAMEAAPIALVAALREMSILFAVAIGVLIFGERLTRAKLAAATLIVGGVVLTRISPSGP